MSYIHPGLSYFRVRNPNTNALLVRRPTRFQDFGVYRSGQIEDQKLGQVVIAIEIAVSVIGERAQASNTLVPCHELIGPELAGLEYVRFVVTIGADIIVAPRAPLARTKLRKLDAEVFHIVASFEKRNAIAPDVDELHKEPLVMAANTLQGQGWYSGIGPRVNSWVILEACNLRRTPQDWFS